MPNLNDKSRDTILRHLHSVHQKARSPKRTAIGIRDLNTALRPGGMKQQEVASNLDYLIQKGWAVEQIEPRSFTTPQGTTQHSEKRTYKISDIGIDRLESASLFEREEKGTHLNITNIHGVTVVGDGNIVNTELSDLPVVLADLRSAVLASVEIPDSTKLNATADIDSLQSQIQKPEPNTTIVTALWSSIQNSLIKSGLDQLVAKASELLAPLT